MANLDNSDKLTEKTPLLIGSECKNPLYGNDAYICTENKPLQEDTHEPIRTKGSKGENGKKRISWKISMMCILLNEMCERMTYFSASSNMVIFCTNVLLYTSVQAVTINLIFTGLCYMLPVFGGYIADTISGRFNAIYGGTLIYLVGALLLVPVAIDYTQLFEDPSLGMSLNARRGFFLLAIVLIGFGTSGLKANVSPFGAQQVEDVSNDMIRTFFTWFYWFTNFGTLVALTGLVYVQQEISFALGYFIAAFCMVLSIILFLIPRNIYKKTPPRSSAFIHGFKIIKAGLEYKRTSKEKLPWFLDYASDKYGGPYPELEVEGIRSQIRMLPVFFCGVSYSITYSQILSTYILQGERMDLQLGHFTIPVASLGVFNTLFVMILIPFVDRIAFPLLSRCHIKPTQVQRMGFGFFLGALSVAVAGWLEIARKNDLEAHGPIPQEVAGVVYNASSLSVLWQAPQYILSGSGEIFAAIGGLEFAYSQAPKMLQGMTMGFYLVTLGAGAFLGSALLNIVNAITAPDEWIPNEINNGHLENYYFLLSGITLLVLVGFIIYTKWFFKFASYSIDYDITVEDATFGSLEIEKSLQMNSSEYEQNTTESYSQSDQTDKINKQVPDKSIG